MLFLMFAFAMPILMLVFGAAMLWVNHWGVHGWVLGAAGGVVGTLFGLVGAFIGVRADMRRKQLREMLAQAEASQAGDQMALSK